MYIIQVVPGRTGGGSFKRKKNYDIASCMMKYRVGTRQWDSRPCFRSCVAMQMQRLLVARFEQDGLRHQSLAIREH